MSILWWLNHYQYSSRLQESHVSIHYAFGWGSIIRLEELVGKGGVIKLTIGGTSAIELGEIDNFTLHEI